MDACKQCRHEMMALVHTPAALVPTGSTVRTLWCRIALACVLWHSRLWPVVVHVRACARTRPAAAIPGIQRATSPVRRLGRSSPGPRVGWRNFILLVVTSYIYALKDRVGYTPTRIHSESLNGAQAERAIAQISLPVQRIHSRGRCPSPRSFDRRGAPRDFKWWCPP